MSESFVWDPYAYRRRSTREVRVGDVGVGGQNPIRVQSMTTTDTQDTAATVAQVRRLVEAGCEIVRITAPSQRDAENLGAIKRELLAEGVSVPLVADIHFTPNAAMIAAEHVEKVRVNPGNYADKKRFEVREYADDQYREAMERVQQRFRPLVRRCRELGRALRIGTNHGSLSDRIMNRYGDTPQGMVESALEFLEVCEQESFHDVVFSMKASNPQVAIHAYRLLAARLEERAPGKPGYPFHVGVTEAGDGEDGRVKSAIGIGALLEDGIGDTIRVSLTEDPVKEVPVARALAARYDARRAASPVPDPGAPFVADPFGHGRRATRRVVLGRGPRAALGVGGDEPVRVEVDLGPVSGDAEEAAAAVAEGAARMRQLALEGLCVEVHAREDAGSLAAFAHALAKRDLDAPLAVRVPPELVEVVAEKADRVVLQLEPGGAPPLGIPLGPAVEWSLPAEPQALVAVLDAALASGQRPDLVSVHRAESVHVLRLLAARLQARGAGDIPFVLRHRSDPLQELERALLVAATDLGAPLCDGIGDLVSLGGFGPLDRTLSVAYRILQGARQRTSWTEFISCPSCGRTLFDLEETTARIKELTQHLPGVKIAVMGCIVNGPGEMADADFGYVGSGVGKVNLYVGQQCVVRNVPEAQAPTRLVDLIRERGRWVDREETP